jgi:hypothetical protein
MPLKTSLEATAEALRQQAAALREAGQHRYPEQLRRDIADCLAQLRHSGVSWHECKERLGICKASLAAWSKNYSSAPETAMVRVAVRPDAREKPSSGLVLQTPNGNRLSGFDLAEAAQLLRALG